MVDRDPSRPAAGESDWFTLGQAARYLGVAQSTIRKWSDGGRVPAFTTPGGHRRFKRGDLDAFLELSRPAPAEPAGQRPLVVIVDDDAGLREYVRLSLEADGYLVREAANAAEGLAAIDEQPPDLILLDVMMPDVDGWELLRRLRSRHGIGTIPVIMFSGKIDDESAAAEAHGAQGFIGKPFDPQQLIDSTRQVLPT